MIERPIPTPGTVVLASLVPGIIRADATEEEKIEAAKHVELLEVRIPDQARGLSGSPIWYIDNPLTASACRLIGITVAWDLQNHSWVAARPEAIVEFWRANRGVAR